MCEATDDLFTEPVKGLRLIPGEQRVFSVLLAGHLIVFAHRFTGYSQPAADFPNSHALLLVFLYSLKYIHKYHWSSSWLLEWYLQPYRMNSFFSSGWGNSAFHSRGNSGYHFQSRTELSHIIPNPTTIISPTPGAVIPNLAVTIAWEPVTDPEGVEIENSTKKCKKTTLLHVPFIFDLYDCCMKR
jgi:hypothetical protein